MDKITKEKLAKMFDHTLLRADATHREFQKLCEDSMKYGFAMVAVNSYATSICKKYLWGSDVHVGAAISFPLGQTSINSKVYETKDAIQCGADEIDYVINLGELKNGNLKYLEMEMRAIVDVCREQQVISKVIFENCYLTKDEIKQMAAIAVEVMPDFIKTSTGFGTGGAIVEDICLMKSIVGDQVAIKAAGGIRNLDTCLAMIEAGAVRIGTSSSIRILEEFEELRGDSL